MNDRGTRKARFLVLWVGAVVAGCGGGGGDDADAGAGGARRVGGTVTGLFGTLVLENNGGDDLTLTGSGSFEFATGLDDGAAYEVTIKSQAGAACSVAEGSGTVAGADVSDVAVTCLELVAFTSAKALDGSDAINDNLTTNVWVVAADGTGLAPLTRLTMINPQAAFDPAWSPDGTRLAFVSQRSLGGDDAPGSAANIWVMNADGTDPRPLTSLTASGADCYEPRWSPDGSRITFYSARALDGGDDVVGPTNLWIMNADGSDQAPLTENTIISTGLLAAWSPDGTRIAFQSNQGLGGPDTSATQTNIWVIALDGSVPPAALTHGTMSSSYAPAWSPDGTRIAFASDRNPNGNDEPNLDYNTNIWVTSSNGSGTQAVTALVNATSLAPTWSPDGQQILYRAARALDGGDSPGAYNLWVADADGGDSQPLTHLTAAVNLNGRFSPDGGRIVFESSRSLDGEDAVNDNNTRNIWLMTADGGDQTALTMGTANQAGSFTPAWVP